MKIRQHRADAPELEARVNEDLRLAFELPRPPCRLDGPDRRRPHRDYTPRCTQTRRLALGHPIPLRVQTPLLHLLRMQRLKRPEPHVQRHIGDLRAAPPYPIENLAGEMQPRRRS